MEKIWKKKEETKNKDDSNASTHTPSLDTSKNYTQQWF